MGDKLPELRVKIIKKLHKLTFKHGEKSIDINIDHGTINLLEIDQWITELLLEEFEKDQLRKRLSGSL